MMRPLILIAAVVLSFTVSAAFAQRDSRRPDTAPVANDTNSATTDPYPIKEVWATSTGSILILRTMPEGVDYFRVDDNQEQKLRLLLFAAERQLPVRITYTTETTCSTRAVFEVRLTLLQK
jgi:hypothetical protein